MNTLSGCKFAVGKYMLWKTSISRISGSLSLIREFSNHGNQPKNESMSDKLPLPDLYYTIKKYLTYAKPFLSEKEYISTQKAAEEFIASGNLGERLQLMLKERHMYTLNWQFDTYRDITYLERRLPLPFYTTPTGQLYYKDWTADKQLSNASGYIRGLARAQYILEDDSSSYVEFGGKKLDKKLWRQVFYNYHFPSKPMDYVVHYGFSSEKPTHFIVAHKNKFFKLEVRGRDGLTYSKKVIEGQMKQIFDMANETDVAPVGFLTWLPRDEWADAYKLLEQDPVNRESLDAIHRAGLVVPVDSEVPRGILNDDQHTAQLELGIHGGGPKYNAANRWFDKLGFVIHKQFGFGILMEHSVLDGFPCMWIMFTAEDEMLKNDVSVDSSDTDVPKPKLLEFNVNEDLQNLISKAKDKVEIMTNDVDVCLTNIPNLGTSDIKKLKISPNGLCQMAQQLAYYKVNGGKMDHILEAAGLLHYYISRTDGIRCSSSESIKMCQIMCDSRSSSSDKLNAVMLALKVHKEEMIDVMTGNGLDNHLAMLYETAKKRGIERHSFFDDAAFTSMFDYRLTGTQVAEHDKFASCMGPWLRDTTCTLYFVGKHRFQFSSLKQKSAPLWSASAFNDAFRDSLLEMWALLSKSE